MLTGKEVKCPKCGQMVDLPDNAIDFPCSECGAIIHYEKDKEENKKCNGG